MDIIGKVAVASTFSPRFLPLLAEAQAFAALLRRPLEVIHAGTDSAENQARFSEAFAEMGFSGPVHWREAAQPSTAIIQVVREAGIGMLIAGAMDRDSEGRFFLGKVARVLVREAPCSLLLYTTPARKPAPLQKLAVIVDYTDASRHALRAAMDLAIRASAREVHVLRVFTVFAQVLAEPHEYIKGRDSAGALAAEEAKLEAFVRDFDVDSISIYTCCIEGTTGFAAADYVHSLGTDLLVVAGEVESGHAKFPARMEWLENVIPSNLLVIRPPHPAPPPPL